MLPDQRLLAAAVAAGALLAGRAAAQDSQFIAACYVPASGTVYRIDTQVTPTPGAAAQAPAPGAPKDCLSPTHRKFFWNAQGPRGAKGDPGAKGDQGLPGAGISASSFAVRRFPFGAPGAFDATGTFRCNAGEVLLSANVATAETSGTSTLDIGYTGVVLLGDGPGDSGPPRRARVTVNNHGLIAHTMIVSLSCYLPPAP